MKGDIVAGMSRVGGQRKKITMRQLVANSHELPFEGSFLAEPDENRFIRCNGEGVSIRIDLEKLRGKSQLAVLDQLSKVMEQLKR